MSASLIINPSSPAGIVRKAGWEGMRYLTRELILKMGETGVETVNHLMGTIARSVEVSFEPDKAPMRNITENAVSERIDKCVEICLELVEKGYATHRIIDEIPRLLLESLDAVEHAKEKGRRTWGVKDNVLMEADSETF